MEITNSMVHNRGCEEALLLSHDRDDSDARSSMEFDLSDSKYDDEKPRRSRRSSSRLQWLRKPILRPSRSPISILRRRIHVVWSKPRRPWSMRLLLLFTHLMGTVFALIAICAIFFPSYTNPPQRYTLLRQTISKSNDPGRANPRSQKVFIAASLLDKNGRLVAGDWGNAVLSLIDLLGPQNVFLSIYENDPDDRSVDALNAFRIQVPSNSSIVHDHLDLEQFDRVTDLNGLQQLKRIAVLAEVRNRALSPLDDPTSPASQIQWDRLLYLNDVVFDSIDAANLLFNTNVNPNTGLADYRAACAVDFINPFKFYDTYATRDLEGYSIGVPVYPWFSAAGNGDSRRDVLAQTDAVRVKSCWGGMVAFEAKWFQPHLHSPESSTSDPNPALNTSLPLRFRAESDNYWDASECCLIHGDLAWRSNPYSSPDGPPSDTGIYMNPYVRVAYSTSVLKHLHLIQRVERLATPFQNLITHLASLPRSNPRRLQQPGDEVTDRVWEWDEATREAVENGRVEKLEEGVHGQYVEVRRVANPGMFCGIRKLSVIMDVETTGRRYGSAQVPGY